MQSCKDDAPMQDAESPRCWSPAKPVDSPRFSFARMVRRNSAAMLGRPRLSYKDNRSNSKNVDNMQNQVRSPRRSVVMTSSVHQNIVPGLSPKICMHGATCVKYGCTFSHPACRPVDCPDGDSCTIFECSMHHPRSRAIPQFKHVRYCRYGVECKQVCCPFRHPTPITPPRCRKVYPECTGFKLGQVVQVQVDGSEWTNAKIRHIRGAKLTVQVDGCEDTVDVSRMYVQQSPTMNEGRIEESKITEEAPANSNILAANGQSAVSEISQDLSSLLELKLVAIEQEDYLEAQRLKLRIEVLREVEKLKLQKAEAVRQEDFLQAQQIKNQLKILEQKTKRWSLSLDTGAETKVTEDAYKSEVFCRHVRM